MPPGAVSNQPICTWRAGGFVQGFPFLSRKEQRQDRKGHSYLHLELQDASGAIVAKVWAESQATLGRFEAPAYVAVEGVVPRHREELQLNVRRCRLDGEEDRRYGGGWSKSRWRCTAARCASPRRRSRSTTRAAAACSST